MQIYVCVACVYIFIKISLSILKQHERILNRRAKLFSYALQIRECLRGRQAVEVGRV